MLAISCTRKVAINAVQMTYCNHRTAIVVHSARLNQATCTKRLSIVWNYMGQCRHIHYYILYVICDSFGCYKKH